MTIDILLINSTGVHGIYGPLGDNLIAVESPLWLRLTFGYLRKEYTVAALDAERTRMSPEDVARNVEALDPRLVGLICYGHQPSASTQAMPGMRAIATAIKAANPSRVIALAGGHPSALPERTLREEPVDYVIKGEGPRTFEALLRVLGSSKLLTTIHEIPGLVWRLGGLIEPDKIIVNPPAEPLDPDRDLVDQAWDATPPSGYVAHNWHAFGRAERAPYASIYTSLNCPYSCSFCCISSPFGKPGYKTRSARSVADEIEKLVWHHKVNHIKITDEMFVLKPAHYTAIASEIVNRDLGKYLNIWAYARVDTVRPETLALLRAAGFRWLALGIESGDADVRDGADKRLRTDDIVGTVRAIQAAGINVIGNFMFGFRDDTAKTMQATLNLALKCLPEFANFYCTMAYPGSKLYDQALAEGWTLPETWAGYSQHNRYTRPLDTKHVGAAEVLRFRDEAFQEYFSDVRYQNMIERKFGNDTLAQVHKMLSYTLERDLLR